jgi:group I intron endonuclease
MKIFITTNLINGKRYIGKQTHNYNCYLGSGLLLKQAIKKYGKESFKKEYLDFASSKEELNEKEKYWIKKYNAVNSYMFYNLAGGGQGGDLSEFIDFSNSKGRKIHTKEYKKKLSEKMKGNGNPMKDKTHSNEVKEKISAAHKGKKRSFSEEHLENLKDANKKRIGTKLSEETKQKMSLSRKGKTKKGVSIQQIDTLGNVIKEFSSIKEASRFFNISYKDCHYILLRSQTHIKRHNINLIKI